MSPDDHLVRIAEIPVSVSVTMCQRRMKLGEVLSLVPGSFIRFEASCRQPLELRVAGRTIALGEAVRRDRQFGLRLNRLTVGSSSKTNRR